MSDVLSNEINKNSGRSNASTSMERTMYMFEVANEAFSQVLDIFSRFFIDPLLSVDIMEREMNAVD